MFTRVELLHLAVMATQARDARRVVAKAGVDRKILTLFPASPPKASPLGPAATVPVALPLS